MADKIKQYFGNGRDFGVSIEYRDQGKLFGTAHALYQARDIDSEFLLVFGDNLVPEECIYEIKNTEPNTILASMPKKSHIYGAIEMKGRVKIRERKVSEGLVFTGIGHFDTEIFSKIEAAMDENIYDLPEVLNRVENLRVVSSQCGWEDAIYPWDLLSLNSHILSKNIKSVAGKIERADIIGNVEIGEGSSIGGGSYIKGQVKIGRNVKIGPGTVIIGDTSIGDGVEVGALSYIENSIIMENTKVGEFSRIKDSIIGRNCTVNSKFMVISGVRKIISNGTIVDVEGGVVIGDNAEVGASVVVNPCIRIGANTKINHLKVIGEDVIDNASVM